MAKILIKLVAYYETDNRKSFEMVQLAAADELELEFRKKNLIANCLKVDCGIDMKENSFIIAMLRPCLQLAIVNFVAEVAWVGRTVILGIVDCYIVNRL